MKKSHKKISLLFAAAAFAAFAFAACNSPTESTPGMRYPDSLYVSASVLRATGDTIFHTKCSGCHGEQGEGGRGPQLANSDFLMNHRQITINLVLRGNSDQWLDTLVVNGRQVVGGGMPAWHQEVSNKEIAGVLTYLRSVLNDSTVLSATCTGGDYSVCSKTPRSSADMLKDTVAPWEVYLVRDTLTKKNILTF